MGERNQQLKCALAALSFEDREDVLAFLHELQSHDPALPEELDNEEIEELNRRFERYQRGESQGMPADEFMKLMRENYS
jgi:Ca2+-binding EF-hand superfamily protein